MKYNNFLASISSIAIIVATSACMDSSTKSDNDLSSAEMMKAQSRQYARSIEQYSLMAADILAANSDWQDGVYAFAGSYSAIDDATFGAISGNADEIVSSGFCVAADGDALKGYQVTWFNSSDDDEFTLKGVGNNAKGSILGELSTRLPESSFGYLSENQQIEYFGGTSMALPTGCDQLGIPANSPIVINEIDVPSLPEDSYTKTEYTTMACEAGKVGHYLLSIDVIYYADGRAIVASTGYDASNGLPPVSKNISNNTSWNVEEANCQDQIILSTMTSEAVVVDGLNLSMAATGAVGRNLNTSLDRINCRQASIKSEDPSQDDLIEQNYGAPGQIARPQAPREAENTDYDTCAEEFEVADIANAGDVRLNWLRTEAHTTDCGGSAGTFTDSADGFSGTVTHDIWLGDAVYHREVYEQEATNIINANTSREEREQWYGHSIQCQRQEDLNITCNTGYPALASHTLLDSRGYNYRRNNSINGWANTVNMTPNDPANPAWNFRGGASGCQWQEDVTWGCNVGSQGQTQGGERNRTHTASALNLSPTVSSWNVVQPALCLDRRTQPGNCPAGMDGTAQIRQERTYTSNEPNNGSWGSWADVSTDTSGCFPISSSSGSSGGSGG